MSDAISPTPAPGTGHPALRPQLSLAIPADAEQIANATDAVLACLAGLKVEEEKCMAIGLAVQEALANAVVHGCQNDVSKTVQCELSCDDQGRVLIVVADPGPGFDFSASPAPMVQDVYNDHGRGVFLIRQLMDEVSFERGGSVIQMWKY
jgi:serine/threonine-protein kinase RsbW